MVVPAVRGANRGEDRHVKYFSVVFLLVFLPLDIGKFSVPSKALEGTEPAYAGLTRLPTLSITKLA